MGSANASWRAWKKLNINTLTHLVAAYRAVGRPQDVIDKFEGELNKQIADLSETAEQEVIGGKAAVAALRRQVDSVREKLVATLAEAVAAGFPATWGMTASAASWLTSVDELYKAAAAAEAEDLAAKHSKTVVE